MQPSSLRVTESLSYSSSQPCNCITSILISTFSTCSIFILPVKFILSFILMYLSSSSVTLHSLFLLVTALTSYLGESLVIQLQLLFLLVLVLVLVCSRSSSSCTFFLLFLCPFISSHGSLFHFYSLIDQN